MNTATIAKRFHAVTVEPGRGGRPVALDCRSCAQRPAHRDRLCKRCHHRALHRLRSGLGA